MRLRIRPVALEYDTVALEAKTNKYWEKTQAYKRTENARSQGDKFYFMDGPPYTTGSIHLGTAWNKSLKDVVLRYKRMAGFDVWDRAGYDMHGMPTEQGVEKKLKIKHKNEIPKLFA